MEKIFVGIALVVFCGFCGYVLSKKYRLQREYYRQFYSFNAAFLKEVSSSRRPIEEWLKKTRFIGAFQDTVESFLDALKKVKDGERILLFPDFLKEEERIFAEEYFFSLGRGDSEEQKRRFTAADKTLNEYREKTQKDGARYTDLYIKMGVLIGLALLILLV